MRKAVRLEVQHEKRASLRGCYCFRKCFLGRYTWAEEPFRARGHCWVLGSLSGCSWGLWDPVLFWSSCSFFKIWLQMKSPLPRIPAQDQSHGASWTWVGAFKTKSFGPWHTLCTQPCESHHCHLVGPPNSQSSRYGQPYTETSKAAG